MNPDQRIFIVKVRYTGAIKKSYDRKKEPYPEFIEEIENLGTFGGAFVIDDFIETKSMYTVVFYDRVFKLQKDHKDKKDWYVEEGKYEFYLCATAKEAWKHLRSFIIQLSERIADFEKRLAKGTGSEWSDHTEEDDE